MPSFYFYFICLVSHLGFICLFLLLWGVVVLFFSFTECYTAQGGLGLSYHSVITWISHHAQPLKLLFFDSKIYFGNDLNKLK